MVLRSKELIFSLLFIIVTSFSTASISAPRLEIIEKLEQALDAERFYAYVSEQSQRFSVKRPDLRVALIELATPTRLITDFESTNLRNPDQYDRLIYQWLKQNHPEIKVSPSDINWNWNFLKNKLRESYTLNVLQTEDAEKVTPIAPVDKPAYNRVTVDKISPNEELTLDFQKYTSERTTLAAFMLAQQIGLQIYVSSQNEFRWQLESRQARILAEIKPPARNYNKIYLIQEVDGAIHIAVSGVSGADRLQHLLLTMAWVNRDQTPRAKVEIFGDSQEYLRQQKTQLLLQLQNAPLADHVFIGQKSAWEDFFLNALKLQQVLHYRDSSPRRFKQKTFDSEQAEINKIVEEMSTGSTLFDFQDKKSLIQDIIEKLDEPENPFVKSVVEFNIENPSHDFSDVIVQARNNKPLRWRFFSNVWGDELKPIAEALKETGHSKVTYIGTAGALPHKGIQLGDAVYVAQIETPHQVLNLPPPSGILAATIKGYRVAQVDSPLRETKKWLAEANADVVEIEAADLVDTFQKQLKDINVFLLISDVLTTEDTLATAESNDRRKNQMALMKAIAKKYKLTGVNVGDTEPLDSENAQQKRLSSALAERELPARFQLTQKLKKIDPTSQAQLSELLKSQKEFSTRFLEKRLELLEHALVEIKEMLDASGVTASLYLASDFTDGSYNPKIDQFKILLRVRSARAQVALEEQLVEFRKQRPDLEKLLSVQPSRGPPPKDWTQLSWEHVSERGELRTLYAEVALKLGNLALVESRSGRMRFVELPEGAPRTKGEPAGVLKDDLAFFAPDEKTLTWLKKLESGEQPSKVLEEEAKRLNSWAAKNGFIYQIHIEKVNVLPDGAWARLEGDLSDALQPKIRIKMTEPALRSPVAVLEELIHLQQITDSPLDWTKKVAAMQTFVHPYHWFEVSANAQLGSLKSQLRLAHAESEAIQASLMAYNYFAEKFGSGGLTQDLENYFEARLAHAENNALTIAKALRLSEREALAQFKKQKLNWDKIEAADKKLNDLIANNDRKGVRAMLEAYLPWPIMEPLEARAWRNWLKAIELPSTRDRILVFRGMYDDVVGTNAKGERYLMSTVLTRNQGSYTRRLRSLTTLRERFAESLHRNDQDVDATFRVKGPKPASISVLMMNHSIEAEGSPFISTANLEVAFKFGPRQIGAFLIDPRRLVLNALPLPQYAYQEERLTPLIIFPDEVVLYHDYKLEDRGVSVRKPDERKADFIRMLEERLGRKITQQELYGTDDIKGFLTKAYKMWVENFKPDKTKRTNDRHRRANSNCWSILLDN